VQTPLSSTPTMSHAALILKEMAKIDYRPKVLVTFTVGDPVMFGVAGRMFGKGLTSHFPETPACPVPNRKRIKR